MDEGTDSRAGSEVFEYPDGVDHEAEPNGVRAAVWPHDRAGETTRRGEGLAWIDKSGSGLLEQFSDGEPDVAARAAADAMESLVLALASAGVDVASPSFIQGFGVAVESVAQRLDDYPDVGHIQKPR